MGIESLLPPLKTESLQCIYNLQRYVSPPPAPYPKKRSAAVAVVIFVGRLGDLYVLLSTRAGNMRTYAHDTALPGGKYEDGDVNAEGTARREAYEEIGLPMDRDKVRRLCELPPYLTGNSLIVTPVVLLITDHTLVPLLNPSEVQSLFSMPFSAFLHSRPSSIPSFHYRISHRLSSIPSWVIDSIPPPPKVDYADDDEDEGEDDDNEVNEEEEETTKQGTANRKGKGRAGRRGASYYSFRDVGWGQGKVRMHRFLTGREAVGVKPIYGLTAAILIQASSIGYSSIPDFVVLAPGQRAMEDRIAYEIEHVDGPLRRAVQIEGLEGWSHASKTKAKL